MSPLASWWNPWAVSFLSSNWVRKDACIFVVTGCIDTIQSVINNFTMLKGLVKSAWFFYPSTNRCPLWTIGKPPWSLWLNLYFKFIAWLRDLTDKCICGVQRWGSHLKIMLNTIIEHRMSPCNLLCDMLSTFILLNLFRLTITKVEYLLTQDISAFHFDL